MQEFSERKESKLSLKNYESFVPKSKKFLEKEVDLKSIEYSEDDNLSFSIKDDEKKEIVLRRKSSSGSTSLSKIDEFSEESFFNSPTNKNSINCKFLNKIYSTPVSDYFLGIDEYFKDILPERLEYSKTGNYISKEKFFKNNQIKKEKNEIINFSESQKQADLKEEPNLNNSISKTNMQQTATTVIGAIPVLTSKGKFDIPMYCFGFYSWGGKLFLFYYLFYFYIYSKK